MYLAQFLQSVDSISDSLKIPKFASESPSKWQEFLNERYEGGKKKVLNPNLKTKDKYPQVTLFTAIKIPSEMKRVIAEYKLWLDTKKEFKKIFPPKFNTEFITTAKIKIDGDRIDTHALVIYKGKSNSSSGEIYYDFEIDGTAHSFPPETAKKIFNQESAKLYSLPEKGDTFRLNYTLPAHQGSRQIYVPFYSTLTYQKNYGDNYYFTVKHPEIDEKKEIRFSRDDFLDILVGDFGEKLNDPNSISQYFKSTPNSLNIDFFSPAEFKSWGDHFDFSFLTEQQKYALKSYTGSQYAYINDSLRNNQELMPTYKDTLKQLDSIFENPKAALPTDVRVGRKFGESNPIGQRLINKTLKSGMTFMDKGFMSTSLNPKEYHGSFKMELMLPKGSKGFYLDKTNKTPALTSNIEENEVLLPRNTTVKILFIDYDKKTVICELA